MRKSVFILLAILLCFALIVSCNDNPAGEGSDNMTESYRNARQEVYTASKIWLPKLEGVEVILKEIEEEGHWINVAFGGGADLFSQIADVFQKELNVEPLFDTSEMKMWDNLNYTDNGQIYCGNITVFFDSTGPSAPAVGISCHFFKGATVELRAAAGGTVVLKQAGTAVPGNKVTTAVGSDLDLVATPAGGYQFAGWFIGETKISDAATYHDYKVPSSNVVIEARFTQPEMTASYATGRDAVHDVTGIWILPLENIELLGSSDTDSSNMVVCFDIPAEKSTYELLAADIRTKIGRDPDDSSANHSTWLIDRNVGGQDYSGNMSIMHVTDDPGVGNAVYLNCVMTPLSPYFAKARARFHELTGVLLPPISDIATEDDASDLAEVDEWDLGEGGSGITFDIWGGASIADWNQIKDYLETAWGDASDNGSAYYWAVPSLTTWYFKLYYWNGSGDDIILNLEPNI